MRKGQKKRWDSDIELMEVESNEVSSWNQFWGLKVDVCFMQFGILLFLN